MKLDLLDLSRQSDYFGGFHHKETRMIQKYAREPILHLFSGKSMIGDVRIDLSPKSNATLQMDVFEFLSSNSKRFKTVIFDPIYSHRMAQHYAKATGLPKDELYVYSFFRVGPTNEQPEKTNALHQGILQCQPSRIISKTWTKPPFENKKYGSFRIIDGIIGNSGGGRPFTALLVFQKTRLDDFFTKKGRVFI